MEVEKKFSKYPFWKVFVFMYVLFPFRIAPIAGIMGLFYYGCVLLVIMNLLNKIFKGKINKSNFVFLIVFFWTFMIVVLLTVIVPAIKDTWDYSYFVLYVNILIKIFCSFILIINCKDIHEFVFAYLMATSLYVFFSLILLIPSVRGVYEPLCANQIPKRLKNSWQMKSLLYYTRYGLQGFSGFEHTYKCSLGIIFGLWELGILETRSDKKRIIRLMFINFLGCCLYGRVGILSSIVSIGIYFIYVIVKYKRTKLLFALIFAFFFLVSLFLIFVDEINSFPVTRWMFEPFINLIKNRSFESESSNSLLTMWRIPSINTFVWGDGRYTSDTGGYYTNTDVGFIRPILFWGMFGSVPYYLLSVVLCIPIFLSLKKEKGRILVFLIIVQLFLYELKGETNTITITVLFPMAAILCIKEISQYSYINHFLKILCLDARGAYE